MIGTWIREWLIRRKKEEIIRLAALAYDNHPQWGHPTPWECPRCGNVAQWGEGTAPCSPEIVCLGCGFRFEVDVPWYITGTP